jgi:hypothetical protein
MKQAELHFSVLRLGWRLHPYTNTHGRFQAKEDRSGRVDMEYRSSINGSAKINVTSPTHRIPETPID